MKEDAFLKTGDKPEKAERTKIEFKNLAEAEEYLEWKKTVPDEVRKIVESQMMGKYATIQTELPLANKFLNKLADCIDKKEWRDESGIDEKISNLLAPLSRVETKGGYLNVFETLASPDASWNLKTRIYDTQIKIALEWLIDQDLKKLSEEMERAMEKKEGSEESESKTEQSESPNESQPPPNEDARSSMESGTEKREGEPQAIFSVAPFYGGYYKQLNFSKFGADLRWSKQKNEFAEPAESKADLLKMRILSGKIHGNQPLSLPVPYDWTVDAESLLSNVSPEACEVLQNQDGLWYLNIKEGGIFDYQIKISPRQSVATEKKFEKTEIDGSLSPELLQKAEALKGNNWPKMKLAREIVKEIRNYLTYSNSREAWMEYSAVPEEFFNKIWQRKEADCFVANTMAVKVLTEAGVDCRFVGGYFVKEKDKDGKAIMHSGNGHAWLEVWDDLSQRAIRLDATPKGDPAVDEQQQEKDLEDEQGEGDFGESEDEMASEKEVQEQIDKMRGESEGKKKDRKIPPFDVESYRFSKLAECSPEQAKEFLRALERVREIKDEKGNPISDLLKDEWKKIIIERKIKSIDYKGPVRMDEGDQLEDPVSARIDILSKEFNPTGFEKQEVAEKLEADFGGMDIYFSFDLSGSMSEPDGASGRRKADVQRDVALLFADSLMQCAYVSRQQGENSDLLPIKIMVTLASSRGEISLPLTDKWTPKEQWAFYSALIKTASGGTPTHETLKLIEKNFDVEAADLKKKNVSKDKLPIHYVAEISDGSPDDFSETEAMHNKLKAKGASVRSYCIGGKSASADAADPLESFSQLPQILSRDIIEKFRKLNPKRIKP